MDSEEHSVHLPAPRSRTRTFRPVVWDASRTWFGSESGAGSPGFTQNRQSAGAGANAGSGGGAGGWAAFESPAPRARSPTPPRRGAGRAGPGWAGATGRPRGARGRRCGDGPPRGRTRPERTASGAAVSAPPAPAPLRSAPAAPAAPSADPPPSPWFPWRRPRCRRRGTPHGTSPGLGGPPSLPPSLRVRPPRGRSRGERGWRCGVPSGPTAARPFPASARAAGLGDPSLPPSLSLRSGGSCHWEAKAHGPWVPLTCLC